MITTMLYLLKLEWLKLSKYMTFRWMMLMFIFLLIGSTQITLNIDRGSSFFDIKSFFMFPKVWNMIPFLGRWISFFIIGFISIMSITNEYSNKTFRQNTISGLPRIQFFFSKVLLITTLSLLMSGVVILLCFIYGLIFTPIYIFSDFTPGIEYFVKLFLCTLGYGSLGLFIGFLFKRSGVSLFFYLAYSFLIELFLRYVIHQKIIDNGSNKFYPIKSFDDLINNPVLEAASKLDTKFSEDMNLSSTQAIITSIIFIALLIFGTYQLSIKRDI